MDGQHEDGVFIKSDGVVNDLNSLKITIVGDPMVGKTCVLITYTTNRFPHEYIPTVFDNCPGKLFVKGIEHSVYLWDTAGQEEYERLRTLTYTQTNCFLLCFSIDNRTSFENTVSKWYPEVNRYSPKATIILIGTKSDLRRSNKTCVTLEEAISTTKKIGAAKYLECSALKNEGLCAIFAEAASSASKKSGCLSCTVL